ncbi:MAG: undecaprenyl-diphosphate phosphatase [Lachnospiraceae bacterium]|nr:undecaprenyl-diphosphate phosphatase [Lachnospiraceae bacterium]
MNAILEFLKVVVFGLVEGFTEWLPISSTGHLILVENIVHLNASENFMNVFRVVIQLGAIMAVVVLYFRRLNPFDPKKSETQKLNTWHLWFKIILACLPAAVVGILLDDILDKYLYNPYVVAAMLIIYGILFIVLEKHNEFVDFPIKKVSQINYMNAFYIGLFQLLALIPGTSRSGATILGAMLLGCSRTAASEFTFFLAIPVMFGASLLKIFRYGFAFTVAEYFYLIIGMLVAFVVSMYSIRFLMDYVKRHDFRFFGYYRIVLGVIVLIYFGLMALLSL